MSVLRVVRGAGRGPTETAAYDTALAAAGLHDYNLVTVSSVLPPGPPVEVVETALDLGPTGGQLTVVQARATRAAGSDGPAVAAVGWRRAGGAGDDRGPGVFYEESGGDPAAVRDRVEAGLDAACGLREWEPTVAETVTATADPAPDAVVCAVVCAVYGRADPIV